MAATSAAAEVAAAVPAASAGTDDGVPVASEGRGTEELQELWATSYEGWVSPPGLESQVVYLKPAEEGDAAGEEGECPWMQQAQSLEPTLKLADDFSGVYGLTAFNPMGQDAPHDVNLAKNKLLEAEIVKVCEEVGGTWWRSFGFAGDWHEKGFTVAAPRERILQLAKDFGQGAIFRFYRAGASAPCGAPIMRETVPALMESTEADVPMLPSSAPPISRADPDWAPEEQ